MSVNPKQKRELESMWGESEEAGGSAIPDGTYQFKIVKAGFSMKSQSKPCFKTMLEVVAGPDEQIGETFEVNDNLETKENMGWFKSKLARLNINISELSFEDIENGTLAEQLKGKVFEGQAKTKGGFLNVYANRMIDEGGSEGGGEEDGEEEEKPKAKKGSAKAEESEEEEEKEEETEEEEAGLEKGDVVTYKGMQAEVVQVLSEEGLVRVKKDDDSIARWKLDAVEKVEAEAEAEAEEEEEEEKEDSEFELPEADDVEGLSAKEVKAALKQLGIDASDIKNPRAVLRSFCALAHDKSAELELSEVAPLAAALELSLKKGTPFKEQVKALAKAVQAKLG
jgi:preprotein translocase subunit YajC/signal recognition particle subunit SEC65